MLIFGSRINFTEFSIEPILFKIRRVSQLLGIVNERRRLDVQGSEYQVSGSTSVLTRSSLVGLHVTAFSREERSKCVSLKDSNVFSLVDLKQGGMANE